MARTDEAGPTQEGRRVRGILSRRRARRRAGRITRAHLGSQRLSEFARLGRRLVWATSAMVLLILVGVLGYTIISGGQQSVIDCVYMTVITLTTVGYGEVIDLSHDPAGRVFTMVILLSGMGIFAYTVLLLATFVIEGHVFNIFARLRMEKAIASLSDHHIVCGEAGVAIFVAEELVRTGRPVVLVVPEEEMLDEIRARFADVPALLGDPSDDEVLLAAGIERASGLVSSMSNDKDNILVAFTARRLNPAVRIISSIERPSSEAKLRVAGANAVVSPSRIGGLRMASELVRPTVVSFLDKMLRDKEAGLRVEEVEIPPDSPIVGQTVGELKLPEVAGAVLLAVQREGEDAFLFDPLPDRKIEAGMTLVLMIDAAGRKELGRYVQL